MLRISLLCVLGFITFVSGLAIKEGYDIGDPVKDFELRNVDGDRISLSDYNQGKGVILVFDCNTCPVSQLYRDRIKELHSAYKSKGYPVVAVNSNDPVRSPGDSFEKMAAYAEAHDYAHDYLQDIDQAVARLFGASNTPHVFVLKNEGGVFKVAYIGAIDNNARDGASADKKYVENAVDALLKGETPKIDKTKAIGCGIKWKKT